MKTFEISPYAIIMLVFCIIISVAFVIYAIKMDSESKKRKEADYRHFDKLRQNLAKLRTDYDMLLNVLDALPMAVQVFSSDGTSCYNNLKARQLNNSEKDPDRTIEHHPIVSESMLEAFNERQFLQETVFCDFSQTESDNTTPRDKAKAWIEATGRPVYINNKTDRHYLITLEDVTDKTQYRHKVMELQRNMSLVLDAGSLGIWEYNLTDKSFSNIHGHFFSDENELTIDGFYRLIHPDDKELCQTLIQDFIERKQDTAQCAIRIRKDEDHDYAIINSSIVCVHGRDGVLAKLIGIYHNDENSQEQQNGFPLQALELAAKDKELECSRLNLEKVLRIANGYIWTYSSESASLKIIYGASMQNDTTSKTDFLKMVQKSDRARIISLWRDLLNGKHDNVSTSIGLKSGTGIRFVEMYMSAVKDDSNLVRHVVGITMDVTHQYRLEEALKINDFRTHLALDSAAIEYWEADTEKQIFILHDNGNTIKRIETWKYISQCMHPSDLEAEYSHLMQLAQEKKEIFGSYEMRLRSKAASDWKTYKVTIVPAQKSADGTVSLYGITLQNISQEVRLRNELRETNIQLELALRAANILPITIDIETQILSANILGSLSEDILGISLSPMTVDNAFDKLLTEDCQKIRNAYNSLVKGDLQQLHQEICVRNGSQNLYLDVKVSGANYERDRRPRTLVGVIQNITAQRQLLQKLHEAKIEAEEANKLKSAYLANMSHEIRTPLNAIVGFSELVAETDNKDERAEYSSVIRNNNEQLLHLVGDILDLSKIEAGMLELNRTKIDLAQLFVRWTNSLSVKCDNPQTSFLRESPYKSCIVTLDAKRLAQIVTNFVTNALKYTPSGKVLAGYKHDGQNLVFYVKDTGIGVPLEKQKNLFSRYQKLDNFAQGTGLGLSIVKQIVENSGGRVSFESEEGKGSCFYAHIPCEAETIAKDENEAIVEILKKSTISDPLFILSPEKPASYQDKILIVEDDPDCYFLMQRILKGYTTVVVNDGAKAIAAVKDNDFDIVLMDLKMPNVDGITATKEIRKSNKIIPIIAVTANALQTDCNDATEAGCNEFITKPINKDEMLKAVEYYLPKSINVAVP